MAHQGWCNSKCPHSSTHGTLTPDLVTSVQKFAEKCRVLNKWKRGRRRETPCRQALHYTATSKSMPPSAPCPSVNPSILNPSYPSYIKSSAKATSLLNPSTSSPTHCVSRLPPSAPNLTKFDSLFSKRLLKFRYELSSLRLSVSSTELQLLSRCSDSSGHSMSPVQGQLFILPLLLHTSFHPVSSCHLLLSPPGTVASWQSLPTGTFAFRHPCLWLPCLWASLPTGTLDPYSHFFSFL